MDSHNKNKLNHLLRHWSKGVAGVQSWLTSMGISRQLADRYCKSQWIRRIGEGAYCLIDDELDWRGAVYALQFQLHYKLHVAAATALEMQGHTHYVAMGKGQPVWLMKSFQEKRLLPRWFTSNFKEKNTIHYLSSHLFEDDSLGNTLVNIKDFQLNISTPERAILECFDLAPDYCSLEQIQFLMQGMTTLRPKLLQNLLEQCRSTKVKRLFLLFAENEDHPWVEQLDFKKIDLGLGKRKIGKGGYYYSKYQVSLPLKLELHEGYDHDEE